MAIYKITWESLSPWSTELQSDTIFGHFAWAIRYLKGGSCLSEIISELKQRPAIVLSSAFPKGKLPVPALPLPPNFWKNNDRLREKRKKLKEIKYIDAQTLLDRNYCFDWKTFYEHEIQDETDGEENQSSSDNRFCNGCPPHKDKPAKTDKKPEEKIIIHNTIDRLTGTTSKEGANLYASEVTYSADNYQMESYLMLDTSLIDERLLSQILDYVSAVGFGKDKSAGKGRFRIAFEQTSLPEGDDNCAWLNLSNMVPAPSDPVGCYVTAFTKFGKLGGDFACSVNPFKYPIYMFRPGSVFLSKKPVGTILTDVHPQSKELDIIQNLYSFSVPFKHAYKED